MIFYRCRRVAHCANKTRKGDSLFIARSLQGSILHQRNSFEVGNNVSKKLPIKHTDAIIHHSDTRKSSNTRLWTQKGARYSGPCKFHLVSSTNSQFWNKFHWHLDVLRVQIQSARPPWSLAEVIVWQLRPQLPAKIWLLPKPHSGAVWLAGHSSLTSISYLALSARELQQDRLCREEKTCFDTSRCLTQTAESQPQESTLATAAIDGIKLRPRPKSPGRTSSEHATRFVWFISRDLKLSIAFASGAFQLTTPCLNMWVCLKRGIPTTSLFGKKMLNHNMFGLNLLRQPQVIVHQLDISLDWHSARPSHSGSKSHRHLW